MIDPDTASAHLRDLPGPPLLCAGMIARHGDGRIAKRLAWGRALKGERFVLDAPFRVASVSKMIAAVAVMHWAARSGANRLRQDVGEVLGFSPRHPAHADVPVTLAMLLSHTSGLRNGADFPVPAGESLGARLTRARGEKDYGGWFAPDAQAQAYFSYSDTNYALAGQWLEKVSGKRFDLVMREFLFQPLSLDCGYNWSGVTQKQRDRAVEGARLFDGVWTTQVDDQPPPEPEASFVRGAGGGALTTDTLPFAQNGFQFAPHGGLRLSMEDMDVLAQLFAGRRALPNVDPAILRQMEQPVWSLGQSGNEGGAGDTWDGFFQAFGLGVHVPVGAKGDAFFGAKSLEWRGHFGDAYGWMTGLFWNTRSRATIVYALNGMPETQRPPGKKSGLTAPEESLVDMALAALARD